jgi:1,4-dihydroxy-2-naphthoate octaprenyltransferase
MSGGAYYVTTGSLEPWVLVASLPYAILVTTVLMGRHIDRYEIDVAAGARTLPVILGRERALFLNQELMVSFFVLIVCLVLVGTLGVWALASFFALPSLWYALRAYGRPRPELPPAGFALWPLWYVAWTFHLARTAGALLVFGLLLNAIFPIHLG